MKFIKTLLAVSLVTLCAFVFVPTMQAAAGIGSMNFGITNASLAANTTYTNTSYASAPTPGLGNLSPVDLRYNTHATLVFTGTSIVTNASTVTIKLLSADEDYNLAGITSTPAFSWTVTLYATGADGNAPVTNTFIAMTNVPSSYIGAAGCLSLYSVANGSTGGTITTPVLKAKVKNSIAPQ